MDGVGSERMVGCECFLDTSNVLTSSTSAITATQLILKTQIATGCESPFLTLLNDQLHCLDLSSKRMHPSALLDPKDLGWYFVKVDDADDLVLPNHVRES